MLRAMSETKNSISVITQPHCGAATVHPGTPNRPGAHLP
jgi:hypothetical protein